LSTGSYYSKKSLIAIKYRLRAIPKITAGTHLLPYRSIQTKTEGLGCFAVKLKPPRATGIQATLTANVVPGTD